jgi:hypothetical protein
VRHSRQAGHHHAERYSIGEKNQRRTRVNPWTCVLFSPRALSCSSWVAWKRAPEEDKRKEESSIFLNQYHKLCKCKKYLNNQSNQSYYVLLLQYKYYTPNVVNLM